MSQTPITAGQSLVDVAIQELGTVAGLFDLADAAGLAITDVLTPGAVLPVPDSTSSQADVVSYFAGRTQRLNTGAPAPRPLLHQYDFSAADFWPADFATRSQPIVPPPTTSTSAYATASYATFSYA